MQLLVILSALLSMLTGAMSGARMPDAHVHQSSGLVAPLEAARSTQIFAARSIRTYLALAEGWPRHVARIIPRPDDGFAVFSVPPRYEDKPRK